MLIAQRTLAAGMKRRGIFAVNVTFGGRLDASDVIDTTKEDVVETRDQKPYSRMRRRSISLKSVVR